MLCANNITVSRGRKVVLERVEMTVEPGRVVALLGPNGAGKSTLLGALAGDHPTSRGVVELGGVPVSQIELRELARSRAVLLQKSTLVFPFTVRDVVRMGGSVHTNLPRGCRNDDLVREAMELAGVTHLGRRRYQQLSGGEQQRVQFARVLVQLMPWGIERPRYLLLDEPTASLDIAHAIELLGTARRLATEHGVGVAIVLHDLNMAARWADEVVLLDAGAVAARGTPREVLTSSLLERVYGVNALIMEHPCADAPLIVARA